MTYAEAMRRYASDKPDLRIPLELVDIADLVRRLASSRCSPARPRIPNGRVAALRVPEGGTKMTRKEIDDCTPFVARYGAKGLAYVKVNEKAKGRDGLQSPILKFLSDDAISGILSRTGAVDGDLIFFGADNAKVVNDSIGALRLKLGHDLGLVQTGWQPLWVVDFPMFEWDADAKRWGAMHHPFTSPRDPDAAALRADPANAVAKAYDMVLNGSEIGGGSVRIHRQEMQSTVFDLLGIGAEEAQKKFGFLLEALKLRHAAARRHRVRPRSHRDVHGGHGQHPRRDRVPEDADRRGPDDRCADDGVGRAAEGAAHPGEAAGQRIGLGVVADQSQAASAFPASVLRTPPSGRCRRTSDRASRPASCRSRRPSARDSARRTGLRSVASAIALICVAESFANVVLKRRCASLSIRLKPSSTVLRSTAWSG